MPRVISLDPGYAKAGALGWTLFSDYFVTGGIVRRKKEWSPEQMGIESASAILRAIASDLVHTTPHLLFDHVVVEKMKSYAHAKQQGDQNDLINLTIASSLTAGFLVGASGRALRVVYVAPDEWKQNVPKDVMVGRIKDRLDSEERSRADAVILKSEPKALALHHNYWDAMGLNLHAHGRLIKGRSIFR